MASLSISSLLVFSSVAKVESPVTLPPGRARLATRPSPTGSPTLVITMGIVVVAPLGRKSDPVAETTIKSTLRRTSSAASSSRRSEPSSPHTGTQCRYSFPQIPASSALVRTLPPNSATGGSAIIQETDANDFPRLLRLEMDQKSQWQLPGAR